LRNYIPELLPSYTTNFYKLAYTASTGKDAFNQDAFPIDFASVMDLPLPLPELFIAVKRELSNVEIGALKADVQKIRPGMFGYKVKKPCLDTIANIPEDAECVVDYKPAEGTSVTGLRAMLVVRKIAQLFINLYDPIASMEVAPWLHEDKTGNLSAYNTKYSIETKWVDEMVEELKKRRNGVERAEGFKKQTKVKNDTEVTIHSSYTGIAAKAPMHPRVGSGPAASCPELPGILFPYFSRMLITDSNLVLEVI